MGTLADMASIKTCGIEPARGLKLAKPVGIIAALIPPGRHAPSQGVGSAQGGGLVAQAVDPWRPNANLVRVHTAGNEPIVSRKSSGSR